MAKKQKAKDKHDLMTNPLIRNSEEDESLEEETDASVKRLAR